MASAQVRLVRSNVKVPGLFHKDGYSVEVTFSLSMGECYEALTHHAVFENRDAAQRYANKVQDAIRAVGPYTSATAALDLSHWLWQPSCASYDGRLQVPPTATKRWVPAVMLG